VRPADFIVLGSMGLIGSNLCRFLADHGHHVLKVHSANYDELVGSSARVLVNCSGNAFRFRANQDPVWNFSASVESVQRSLFDFPVGLYIHISTVDVYHERGNPAANRETAAIDTSRLDTYGFHKWLAERVVEKYAQRSLILRVGTVVGEGLKKGPVFDLLRGAPMHMSLDSKLSIIDTDHLAQAVGILSSASVEHEIFNLTGTGPVELRFLATLLGDPVHFAEGAEETLHLYDISNDKIRDHMPMPTSIEMAGAFMKRSMGRDP